MSAVTDQRPLDLGRALDAALLIYRRNFVAVPTAAAAQLGVHLAATTAIAAGLDIVAHVLVAPVSALLMALLYFDQRLRREGGDIAAMLDALPAPAGEAAR